VQQAAETGEADDLAARLSELLPAQRCPQPKAPMQSRQVVVLDVLPQDMPEMALARDQQPVQRLATYGSIQRSQTAFACGACTGVRTLSMPSVAADGASADGDAELEELASDPLGAPVRVLGPHGGDQLTDLGVEARSAQSAAGPPAPEQAPTLAMPAQHGLGPDQEEVASPAPVEAADDEPEELVASLEARPALGAESDLELLAEEQVLDEEALAAAESASEGGQEEAEEFDHPRQDRRSSPPPPGPARLLPPYKRSPGWPRQDAADRGQEKTVGGLPAGPTDLSLDHSKLVAERQHLGAEPGVGPAADDHDLQQEADGGVEEGVEHDRGASQRPARGRELDSSFGPKRTDAAGVNGTGRRRLPRFLPLVPLACTGPAAGSGDGPSHRALRPTPELGGGESEARFGAVKRGRRAGSDRRR
jgi:hypothetical protein